LIVALGGLCQLIHRIGKVTITPARTHHDK
jgi:hypothetical protein